MSYHIVYGLQCVRLGSNGWGEDVFAMFKLGGDNNCYSTMGDGAGQRSRDWSLRAIGSENDIISKAAEDSASMPGGCLKISGRSTNKPEDYIRMARRAVVESVTLEEAERCGARFDFTIILPTAEDPENYNRAEVLKVAAALGIVGHDVSRWSGERSTGYTFDRRSAEHFAAWLKLTTGAAKYATQVYNLCDMIAPCYGESFRMFQAACLARHKEAVAVSA